MGQLLRLVVRENSHFLLHLEGIAPDCLQVGSDLVVVRILVDIVLSGRDGESLVVLVLGDSVLLLMAQMLLVLILDLLEVVKDLGDLLFVGGDALVEKEKRFGDDLKLAYDLLKVLGKLLILSKTSTSVLLIAIGIRLGRNNDALRPLGVVKTGLRRVVIEASGLGLGLSCLNTLSGKLIIPRPTS